MRLDEDAVRSRDHRAPRQHRGELPLAARLVAAAARQLHRMRRVEHDGKPGTTQDGDGSHVRHQIVVAEGRAALGDHHPLPTELRRFLHDLTHLRRREELAFLHVHDLAGQHGGFDQIRLATEERRDLENVHDLAGDLGLALIVNIRQHRHAHA